VATLPSVVNCRICPNHSLVTRMMHGSSARNAGAASANATRPASTRRRRRRRRWFAALRDGAGGA